MREIPDDLLARPFTTATAASYGVTAGQLQGARCRRLFHGVYLGAHVGVTVQILAEAIALVLPPGAVVSGATAALLHGADVRAGADAGVDVTTLRAAQIRRSGIRATSAYLESGDVETVYGIPVTSPTRTAFDLARRRVLIERVVGIDAMLNRGGCALSGLATYIDDRFGWRGIRWAREALTYAEPLAESPMETRQRMRLVLAGLPRPRAQYTLLTVSETFVARLDHAYEEFRVAPEYDGEVHRESWRQDNERQELIRAQGWWHRRYTALSIVDGGKQMTADVRRALLERGWKP